MKPHCNIPKNRQQDPRVLCRGIGIKWIPVHGLTPNGTRFMGGRGSCQAAWDAVYNDSRGSAGALPSRVSNVRAFTLFELIIVLAIIVAVTAIAAPSMMDRVRSGRVQEAAEDAREVLAACRKYAIETGVDYHFRFEPGGHFCIAIPAEQNVSLGNSSDSEEDNADFTYRAVQLPETIFLRTSHDDTSGGETLEGPAFGDLENTAVLTSKTWSMPILFRFDGSAEDKSFRVMDEQQRSCDVKVRGLTGTVSVSGVFIMEEQ
jgi:type II secretory pathway pseudopilin PulG